jgi:hypothetical protein
MLGEAGKIRVFQLFTVLVSSPKEEDTMCPFEPTYRLSNRWVGSAQKDPVH